MWRKNPSTNDLGLFYPNAFLLYHHESWILVYPGLVTITTHVHCLLLTQDYHQPGFKQHIPGIHQKCTSKKIKIAINIYILDETHYWAILKK